MESEDDFEGSIEQNIPEVFKINHWKVNGNLGHWEVIVVLTIKLSSRQIALHELFDSCMTGTIIHPLVLKYTNYKIKKGEWNE